MEPGHEDREYDEDEDPRGRHERASMEPGHEDREYGDSRVMTAAPSSCLNGARS